MSAPAVFSPAPAPAGAARGGLQQLATGSSTGAAVTRWRQNIPAELQARPQWVVWSYGQARADGKRPKVPYSPATGKAASVTDPATWGSFDAAIDAWRRNGRYDGIGYVFAEGDPYTGMDFDGCLDAGRLNPRVGAWLVEAGSYAERSPSGQGIKAIVRATLDGPGSRNQRLGLEVYDRERFFALTGERWEGCPSTIAAAQGVADAVYRAAGGGGSVQTPTAAPAAAFASDLATVPSLQPGGPLRRTDGTLRRVKADHWLNCYLLGDTTPYERLAAARGWDAGDSGVRYHGIDSLYAHGYPDEEIAAIARAFLPQSQAGRDTARWWARELHSCLYGPKGAATRQPNIKRTPSRGFVAPPPAPDRGGRPPAATADEVLRYYHEEAGKRELSGPRRRDAEQLGISLPTLERREAELVARGDITIEVLPGRSGRRVILTRCHQNLAAGAVAEVPSEPEAPIAAEGVTAPENANLAPQCIGVSQGVAAEAPPAGDAPAPNTPPCVTPAAPAAPAAPRLRTSPEEFAARFWASQEAMHRAMLRGSLGSPFAEPLKFEQALAATPPPARCAQRLNQDSLGLAIIPPELMDLHDLLELATRPEPPPTPPAAAAPPTPPPTATPAARPGGSDTTAETTLRPPRVFPLDEIRRRLREQQQKGAAVCAA